MDFEEIWQSLKELWEERAPRTWVIVACTLVYAWYKYDTWYHGTFKKMGIKGPRPFPLLGTAIPLFSKGLTEHDCYMKRTYGTLVGNFFGRRPALLIYEPELIKAVTVKEFASFTNRFVPEITDYPLRTMMTMLKDNHWRHVRNTITPTFSSGKLRKMQRQVSICAQTFLANLQEKADKNEIFEFRDISGAYTMDVIASTAFGLQIDSHNDPNNQFVMYSNKIFQFSLRNPKMFLFLLFPYLLKPLGKLGVSLFPKDAVQFFTRAVDKAIEERRSSTEDHNKVDFLQLMVNAENEHMEQETDNVNSTYGGVSKTGETEEWTQKGLTHEEVLAQSILFLLAGFDTTANTLAFLGYLLATNPECQDKIIAEIDETFKGKTEVTYDDLNKMPYLDMCVSETLRLYPAGPRSDRVANEDITINGLTITKGMNIGIPIYALHHDPEFWEDPEKFDPERFLPEAKAARNPYVYQPFGMGPRNCIGMRLALMEMKMALVHILQKLKFVACEETQIPLVLEKIRMRGEKGIKLRMKSRAA